MKGRFVGLNKAGEETGSLAIAFERTQELDRVRRRTWVGLALGPGERFIRTYFETLSQGSNPVVFNPHIPGDVLRTMAEKLKLHRLLLDGACVELREGREGPSALSHGVCSSGATSAQGIPSCHIFRIAKPMGNGAAHYDAYRLAHIRKVLFPLPFHHSFGVVAGLWGNLAIGGTTYFFDEPPGMESILRALDRQRPDLVALTPSLARTLLKYRGLQKKIGFQPPAISVGSSLMSAQELKRLGDLFPHSDLFYTYGLTEMGPRVSLYRYRGQDAAELNREFSGQAAPIGAPLAGVELRVSGGELEVRSPYGADSLEGAFFCTRDAVKAEGDEIHIFGRADATIVCGGINIFPEEIEQMVNGISIVVDSCLVGIKNHLYGKIPVLAVVPVSRETGEAEVHQLLRHLLPPSHQPHRVAIVDAIPKTSLGKPRRTELALAIEAML